MNKPITPINRNNLFYSEEDFNMETDILSDYIEEDVNQSVVLYEVDRKRTNVNETYQESKGKIFYKPPKEIPCLYDIKDNELKSYDSKTSNGLYTISGGLTIYVLTKTLERFKCDIKRGDYIGIMVDNNTMIYFSVVNDGKINNANSMIVGAYKSPWRVITASPVTLEEFNGK